MIGYTNSDFLEYEWDSKCTSSDDFIVCHGLLSLKPKKQSLVFLSSTEAECVGYSEAQEQLLCSDNFILKSYNQKPVPQLFNSHNQCPSKLFKNTSFNYRIQTQQTY